jgi:hypothetical protein
MSRVFQTTAENGISVEMITMWGIKYLKAPEYWLIGEVLEFMSYRGAPVLLNEESARASVCRLNNLDGYEVEAVSRVKTITYTPWKGSDK